ncbi:Pre-mRNA-splicing factor Cwf15/Cwc15 [Multifurca ochricompacta]|uniref:Pre-mRNA-splicing factor Cwf15/Cwc15 n=1 Tax=Multifurca ochricompacta TaxID=376703 RepID=A0AAD4M589_9AGAM|nr:Pre-mRNA-splicing factor Cwf15/Cwc15 [Multifurca ochricompacta]
MSTAHRPTWDPAQAREVKGGSRQYSVRDMAAHTKLKFRQPGQTSVDEVKKRDLRTELLAAEAEARAKKRKAAGLPVEDDLPAPKAIEDEEANKRRKVLQEALEMDRDADSDEDEDDDGQKGDTTENRNEENEDGGDDGNGNGNGDGDDDEDDEDEDEEDDTAELLRELEKIKRERATEKARVEQAEAAATEAEHEARIATANPLLNLAAALGNTPGINTTAPGTFAVKRRWDDDLIFKNQAANDKDKSQGQFVNDLLRTEFHK